jgi:Protein of unknown function (DUF3634)
VRGSFQRQLLVASGEDMDQYWSAILVLLVVAGLLVWLTRPRRVFVISIREGRVAGVSGPVPRRFIGDVERVCAFWGIREGKVIGIRRGRSIQLTVAGGIDAKHAQAFRNAWENPI